MYRPPDWEKFIEIALAEKRTLDVIILEAMAERVIDALKAEGKYIHLHRTFKPPGYKQPLRAPGWVVFIPEKPEGDKGGEVQHAVQP